MINIEKFINNLNECQVDFFTGVPDSLLKDFSAYVMDHISPENHIIAANEGNAIAIAAGVQLATGKIPCVYLQNSGLGNLVNPLVSLASPNVYSIPMLLVIGWRGEPGVKDEPQHNFQGKITEEMLKTMEIPFEIIDENEEGSLDKLNSIVSVAREKSCPVALLVRKGSFETYKLKNQNETKTPLLEREEAIEYLLKKIDPQGVVLSTTGKISRELFETRVRRNEDTADFYNVGSMGHVSQIAYGVSLKTSKPVYCFDGDGAFLMHMGGSAIIGSGVQPKNLIHIILNNCAHDSVGGQPTVAQELNLSEVAKSCGYAHVAQTQSKEGIDQFFEQVKNVGPYLLEIVVRKGARKDLGRPTKSPIENKQAFIDRLRN